MWNKQRYCWQVQNHVWIENLLKNYHTPGMQSTKNTQVELYSEAILWKTIRGLMQFSLNKDPQHLKWQAAKVMDIISRLPGCARQAADAVSAHTQVKMEDAPKLLKTPQIGMSRHLDSSTTTEMAWIQNFRKSNGKITILGKSENLFVVLRNWRSCQEMCGTIFWVGKQDDSTTLQSINSMHWWPSFQRRRNEIRWRIFKSMLSQCSEMLILGHILGIADILWSVNKLARAQILLDTSFYHRLQSVTIRFGFLPMNLHIVQFQYGLEFLRLLYS